MRFSSIPWGRTDYQMAVISKMLENEIRTLLPGDLGKRFRYITVVRLIEKEATRVCLWFDEEPGQKSARMFTYELHDSVVDLVNPRVEAMLPKQSDIALIALTL